MMCFLWQNEIYLWFLPGTACLSSGPSPVDLTCLPNHLPHACRSWYCVCHPQVTPVGGDIAQYSFSTRWAVVYGFSSSYYKVKNVSCEIEDFIKCHLWKLRGILRSCMKQNKDAVWSLVLRLCIGISADPKYSCSYDIMCIYVRMVTLDILLKYVYISCF